MSVQLEFELIITIVNHGFGDNVMDSARSAGAEGGTILNGRGRGVREDYTFFGVPIEPEKEIVLILIDKSKTKEVMTAIVEKNGLNTPGKGISFVLPIEKVEGIAHLLVK